MEEKKDLLLFMCLYSPGMLDAKTTGLNYLELRLLTALYLAKDSLSTEQLVLLFHPPKNSFKNAIQLLKDRSLIRGRYPAASLEKKAFYISEKGSALIVALPGKILEKQEELKSLLKILPLH